MAPIRQARESDLPTALAIERDNMRETVNRLNSEPWSDNTCMAHLRGALERRSLWVYEDSSGVVGHYCYSPMRKVGHVSLDSLQVGECYQGRGVGSSLLTNFLEQASKGGFSQAVLNVHLTNPATHLYERFGFAEMHRSASHIRMERALGEAEPRANNAMRADGNSAALHCRR